MADLRVAVVGCGAVGQVHLACWSNLVGVRIAAVCDTDGSVAAQTAEQYPGSAAFVRLEDLLAAEVFDIVDICTPPDQHAWEVEAALLAGANVLCEKPLTTSAASAQHLVQQASEQNRLLMTAFCHRFHPPVLFARELLENEELGRLTAFRCRFSGFWEDAPAQANAVRDQGQPVGALLDTAVHGIDLFRYFCGEVQDIQGKLATVNPGLAVEDTVALLLQSENQIVGVVEVGWSVPGGRNVLELYGTAGSCIVDYDLGQIRYLTAEQPVWQTREEGGPNRFEREIAHFADAVRGLQTLEITGEDGAKAVELCEKVYRQNPRYLQDGNVT